MTDLLNLAEQCERADAPDREVDTQIWLATTPGASRCSSTVKSSKGLWPDYVIDETRDASGRLIIVPAFTGSIDAAMRLVPEGHDYCLSKGCDEHPLVSIALANMVAESQSTAATPALALCAAALRACAGKTQPVTRHEREATK
jgi:hypothetical protein